MNANLDIYKKQAAKHALRHVEADMILGLGTGSTTQAFIDVLAQKIKAEQLDLTCVATSHATKLYAENVGISIADFNSIPYLDLTIDGADEVDDKLNLIKGGGGALLYEKIVAMASSRVCIIADHSKHVGQLGKFPLPVEVMEFGLAATLAMIETASADAGCKGMISVRQSTDGKYFKTDGGHVIVDCQFNKIADVDVLADVLDIVPGVVGHGLFIEIADEAIIAGPEGIEIIERDRS